MSAAGGSRAPRKRLDLLLVERGLAETRARAQALVMAGEVRLDGARADKAGASVRADCAVEVVARARFVSRGGDKLQGALEAFAPHGLRVKGKVAADLGASTGGFSDCLLQHGAARVHAVDVGHGLLHARIRADPRVRVHERTNARALEPALLGERVDLVVVDASFIGLAKLLGAIRAVLVEPGGELVALVKPQFEAGRREASRGRGVIRDEAVRERVVAQAAQRVRDAGFEVVAQAPCALAGPKGNREVFVYARVIP
jgi:23S rRNA (cytidine1920-2'-O)/16S rRNA (cytidine1409-2'-O)-methyltransferase